MRRLLILIAVGMAGCMNLTPPEELGMDPTLIERCQPSQEEKVVNLVSPLLTAIGRQVVMSDECLQFRRDWAMLDAEASQRAAGRDHFQRTLSLGDFTDQILDPLSRQLADDIIAHEKATLIAGDKVRSQLLSDGDMAREVQLQQQEVALLEPKRIPLQREIRGILVKRTKIVPGGFSICLEGSERIYKPRESGAGFTRVSDKPMVCDKAELQQVRTTFDF